MAQATDTALARLQIGVLTLGFAIVGAAAGGIFDVFDWTLVIAPIPPAFAAVLLISRGALARLIGAVLGVLGAVTTAVIVADGSTGDVIDAVTSGPQGLLSTDWPSPVQPGLLGAVAGGVALACAIGVELARQRRFHLAALVPLLLAYLGVVALSSPLGVRWVWFVGLAIVSIAYTLLRADGTLVDRLVLLRGERRLIPLLTAVAVLVALVAVPVSTVLGTRADPRRNDPARQTASLLDPIEATLALRNLDPVRDLHVVTPTDGEALPVRWRTTALTAYDGQVWSPTLTLRPIGFTLGPAVEPTIDVEISFLDDNLSLVPLPGPPVSVDAPVETDGDRTVVRLVEPPEPGELVEVVANSPAVSSDAVATGVATRVIDESSADLTQLAEGLAGEGTDLERLGRLETTMRDDFVLDSDVQGGGLERALIDRFLRDTQRGTAEQFVTSFVLLARSLGFEARVATGFVAGGADATANTLSPPGEPVTLRSSDADVWPEVQLADGRWIAYDPVPADEAADGPPPPPEPQVQTPAAPQPPIPPPPESSNDNETDEPEADATTNDGLSAALTWLRRGSIGLAVVVVPVAIIAGLIMGVKYRRRRRRLGAPDPVERIRGAWASATDALVDAGLDITASATDAEIATLGTPLVRDASSKLRRLATLSSAATFGRPRHPDLLAEDAVSCLGSVEAAVTSERTRWQRLRWRLSTRSLRPTTRSPVVD